MITKCSRRFISRVTGFSWEALPEGSVLVDVGGGIGSHSLIVAEHYPHLRIIVEDREQVVSGAKSVGHLTSFLAHSIAQHLSSLLQAWGPREAPLFDSGRLSFRARDFFNPWEPLPGDGSVVPSVLLVRLILHDWPDSEARK